MNGGLSNGLPRRAICGNLIVIAAADKSVLLRGVNGWGLVWAEAHEDDFCSAAGVSLTETSSSPSEKRCRIKEVQSCTSLNAWSVLEQIPTHPTSPDLPFRLAVISLRVAAPRVEGCR
jgi:hypothetical protein